jgi:hypothetical protein
MGRSRRFAVFGQNNDTASTVSGETYSGNNCCNVEVESYSHEVKA